MEIMSVFYSSGFRFAIVAVLITLLILIYLMVHYNIALLRAQVSEDLSNIYTPEILKPRPLKKTEEPEKESPSEETSEE